MWCLQRKAFNIKYNSANTSEWEIGRHLEGIFIGPILVALGMSDYFLENIEKNRAINYVTDNKLTLLKSVLDFFITLGWIKYDNNDYQFTEEGLFLCDSNETSNGILSQTQLDKVFKDYMKAFKEGVWFGN